MGLDLEAVRLAVAGDDGFGRLAEATCEAGLVAQGADVLGTVIALADSFGDGAGVTT